MKSTFTLLGFVLLLVSVQAQQLTTDFVRQFGGIEQGFTGAGGVHSGSDGSAYAVGTFSFSADFDPGPGVFQLQSPVSVGAYVLKLNPAGGFEWAGQFASSAESRSFDVEADAAGNVYVAGDFAGITDFDPGAGVYTMVSQLENGEPARSGFVVKLDANGNFLWAYKAAFFQLPELALDAQGNIIASGEGTGSVLKLDPAGNKLWDRKFGDGPGQGYVNSRGLAVDDTGNIFACGGFTGEADFDPGPGVFMLQASGLTSAYIVKLDANGNFIWVKAFNGADEATDITLDAAGNILSTGFFHLPSDFDPGPGVFELSDQYTNASAFISKLDAAGNFIWAKGFYGGAIQPTGIRTDAAGNVFTCGLFNSVGTDFDPGPGSRIVYNSGDSNDSYLAWLNNQGDLVQVQKIGGCYIDEARGLDIDGNRSLYIAGTSFASADFGTVSTTDTSNSLFLAKWKPCANCISTNLCLGNRVWNDLNRNGSDDNEPGIAGLTVFLYPDTNNDNIPDGCIIGITVTDSNGNYQFCNLAEGHYLAGLQLPAGYALSPVKAGDPDNNTDGDNNGESSLDTGDPSAVIVEVRTKSITLSTGAEPDANTNNTLDIGLVQGPLCLGNRIWDDLNQNGQDSGEPGIAGATVGLYKVTNNVTNPFTDPSAVFMGETVTDENGNYSFCSLFPGKYIVYVLLPEGYVRVSHHEGDPDNNKDKDNNGQFGNELAVWGHSVTLTAGQEPGGNTNNTYDIALQAGSCAPLHNDANTGKTEKEIAMPEVKNAELRVFPNPFVQELRIQVKAEASGIANIRLQRVDGKLVYRSYESVVKGNNVILINELDAIPPGIYVLEMVLRNQRIIHRLVKVNR